MKLLSLIITIFSFNTVFSADKKYTQEEFDKKFKEELEKKVDLIKKKSLSQLTKELLEKDRELSKREDALNAREELVKKGEVSLSKNIENLELEKKRLIGCLDENKKGEIMRVQQLVEVISNMKPQKAADLLSVQESTISIKILEKIDPTKASKIFNLMDKEVSARLQKQYLNMQK